MKGKFGYLLAIGIIVVLVLAIGGTIWGTYNSLVTKSQAIDGQWAQVETQYQRRYDLVPNLVNSVKGIMAQEQKVFSDISNARTRYGQATTTNEKAVAGSELEITLGRLLVIMENYPQLRSIEAVTNFMDELAGTENRISIERRRYNELVRDYNTAIKTFPRNMLAGMFGFTSRDYFMSVSGADKAPKVEF
ncbi:MAG: LemA family protein [Dehalococcoidia bacterium]|nr:LemA family protein [Dehalococcoidia bacterium]